MTPVIQSLRGGVGRAVCALRSSQTRPRAHTAHELVEAMVYTPRQRPLPHAHPHAPTHPPTSVDGATTPRRQPTIVPPPSETPSAPRTPLDTPHPTNAPAPPSTHTHTARDASHQGANQLKHAKTAQHQTGEGNAPKHAATERARGRAALTLHCASRATPSPADANPEQGPRHGVGVRLRNPSPFLPQRRTP